MSTMMLSVRIALFSQNNIDIMEYKVETIDIRELLRLIKDGRLNLHPDYQRNFIWSPKEQKMLIKTIDDGYPLPNFFFENKDNGTYDMVDGQQRAMTILKYFNNEFKDFDNKYFSEKDKEAFLSYKLAVIVLSKVSQEQEKTIENFYYLVNRQGEHLNPAEINKARYYNSDFLNLVNSIMEEQMLIDLDIFTSAAVKRMNDRSLIEEVVAYLFKGITDKRDAVEELFKRDITAEEIDAKKSLFMSRLERIHKLNDIHALKNSRFKQRNDFYTLFTFIDKYFDEDDEILSYQYRIMIMLDQNQFIRPSNDDCELFKSYAVNCVTQSNSKDARQKRLEILEKILCSTVAEPHESEFAQSCEYIADEYGLDELNLVKVGNYYLYDLSQLEE